MKDPIVNQISRHAIKVVSGVIEKLLAVAVADAGKMNFLSFVLGKQQSLGARAAAAAGSDCSMDLEAHRLSLPTRLPTARFGFKGYRPHRRR